LSIVFHDLLFLRLVRVVFYKSSHGRDSRPSRDTQAQAVCCVNNGWRESIWSLDVVPTYY
jgi:hypothetical protein